MNSMMSRRQCLKMLGVLSTVPALPSLFVEPALARGRDGQSLSKTLPLMGTLVTVTTFDASRARAEQAQERAFSAMRALIPIFDRFDPDSRLSWLNTRGRLRDVPPELSDVLTQARNVSRLSGNRFDITILPLLELYESTLRETGRPPGLEEIKRVRERIGWDKVSIASREVSFSRSGMGITLDGIAKGYIVDAAAEALRREGIRSALINAGGDIRAVGGKGAEPWVIGVRDPDGRRRSVQTVAIADLAIATSGNYENYFDPFKNHHHIISTGRNSSPRRTVSATAIASDALSADALSTTFFVLDPKESVSLASKLKSVQAFIIAKGGRTFQTGGWKACTV